MADIFNKLLEAFPSKGSIQRGTYWSEQRSSKELPEQIMRYFRQRRDEERVIIFFEKLPDGNYEIGYIIPKK